MFVEVISYGVKKRELSISTIDLPYSSSHTKSKKKKKKKKKEEKNQ